MFTKVAHFAEVWFCDRFYIGGVNILGDSPNKVFVKKVKFSLYKKSKIYYTADLYKFTINGHAFKIAITPKINNIRYIAYLSEHSFHTHVKANDRQSLNLNKDILTDFALKHFSSDKTNAIYSKNLRYRCVIRPKNDMFAVVMQHFWLNPDATIDYPEDTLGPYSYLGYYRDESGISYYADEISAKQFAVAQMNAIDKNTIN